VIVILGSLLLAFYKDLSTYIISVSFIETLNQRILCLIKMAT